jgi:hypothetical protein
MIKFYSRKSQKGILYWEGETISRARPDFKKHIREEILNWMDENKIKIDIRETKLFTRKTMFYGYHIEYHFEDPGHEMLFKLTWL